MVEYIYFVKCPDCEDEQFDFFDAAKEFACGCLSLKPIITQVEVNRNDFGECTDHCDLGTVWSWEDMMSDTKKEPSEEPALLTKDFLATVEPENDPEFAALDNSVEVEDDDFRFVNSEDTRKPIPEGMTIEQLVEEMEENEDMVECTWCNDLFPKDQCRYEVDLGYLCSRCEAAIKSRGETLTFRENNYWDFLDEDTNKDEQLTELFGFGKKEKVNRYIVKLSRDTSDRIVTSDLWNDIYWMIKKIVPNVQEYRENRSFSTYFEFTATEKEFNKVEQEVKHLLRFLPSKYFIGRDTVNSSGVENPDIKASAAQLINFSCVDRDVKESIQEYVERDPFDHHDPDYSDEDAADAIADEIDRAWDSRYDDMLDEAKSKRTALSDCPECGGKKCLDQESGVCNNCGFII